MIRVPNTEPRAAEWTTWVDKATAERRKLEIAEVPPTPPIDERLYKEQKNALLDLFNGKCAYCEVKIEGNQPGDVEHYRPKHEVLDDDGKPIVHPKTGLPHPGYYWLAYDWRNLLPSCEICNRPSKSRAGTKLGKRNAFPIKGDRAFTPQDDLTKELPLLLNPLTDNPDDHLVFDETNGVVGWKTDLGKKTVEILALNRDGLLDQRRSACDEVKGLFLRLSAAVVEKRDPQEFMDKLAQFSSGKRPFCAMALPVIARIRAALVL
jgi:uncharacterized protein (TIGR02646 family)